MINNSNRLYSIIANLINKALIENLVGHFLNGGVSYYMSCSSLEFFREYKMNL